MEILRYRGIEYHGLKKQVDKVTDLLRLGDFKSADVKKMPNTGFFRAKLDAKNRLLFKIGRFQGETYVFILEVIPNHAYDKSRFLSGADIDEDRLEALPSQKALETETDIPAVAYVNKKNKDFHILDKILSFDDLQEQIFRLPLPLIVIGSAGSGKTALTLEKLKDLPGKILYTTLSSFLVENASNLYYSNGYDNDRQEIDFLSFRDYLQGISIPQGREIDYRQFEGWINRYRQAYRIKDSHKIFEEFKGVITGSIIDRAHLLREDYLDLGVRQSVYNRQEREQVYELFEKYLSFLKEQGFYDTNMVAYSYLESVKQHYDYVVVDEVQDLTNVQLYLILRSLKSPAQFLLCGDSNQIVHPNFFSWSKIKSMFYQQDLKGDLIRVLATNYRNTPEVTQIANQLLKVKNLRFGSIDKESTYLVEPNSSNKGSVEFYEDKPDIKRDFDKRTSNSTRFAVLVMRNEDKAEARKFFKTPLLFSVQEAKGLEYENIILFNIISSNQQPFRELCRDVNKADLQGDLHYARAKSKDDKDLEVYKFYVNSLYVAITRAVSNLYVLEANRKHELLELLDLTNFRQRVELKDQNSSLEDWQKEARKLELQGKQEQADDIRKTILRRQDVPWDVITPDKVAKLHEDALNPEHFNKKAKDRLFEYACLYLESGIMPSLAALNYKRAERWEDEEVGLRRKLLNDYNQDRPNSIKPKVEKYGPDFRNEYNLTPLMLATMSGASNIITYLLDLGANAGLADNLGRQAFHLALARASEDPAYTKKTLYRVYSALIPDSMRIKLGNRMIKLHNRQMEFHVLNYMLSVFRNILLEKGDRYIPGFSVDDLISAVDDYPARIMPDYRKRRHYLSAILSTNEVYRLFAAPNGKGLFFRIMRGYYVINPVLEIEVNGTWSNVYDAFFRLDELTKISNSRNLAQLNKHVSSNRDKILQFLEDGIMP